jgi:hypothetical protein
MRTMQTKTSQRQDSRTEQRVAQAQPGLAGQRRSDSPGKAGVLLSLQRSHGNRYVQRLLSSTLIQRDCGCGAAGPDCGQVATEDRPTLQQKPVTLPPFIQAKLTVSQPGDPYEQEADRVADEVMRMRAAEASEGVSGQTQASAVQRISRFPAEQIQREEMIEYPLPEEQQKTVQTKRSGESSPSAPSDLEARLGSLRGSGQPLSRDVRGFMEPRFGYDFSSVRVHTDGEAVQMARDVSARAFTVGNDIYFGAGEYAQHAEGKRLLAHELTHVIQQSGTSQALMRALCDCPKIGRDPTSAETADAQSKYPNLTSGDWCVTGEATKSYNCIAWTVGVTNRWVWDEVDTAGDGDGKVSVSDFDHFYDGHGYKPAVGSPSDATIALFSKTSGPTHAARVSSLSCGGTTMFESKRGENIRIAHTITQLEGGFYGNVEKFYVPK